ALSGVGAFDDDDAQPLEHRGRREAVRLRAHFGLSIVERAHRPIIAGPASNRRPNPPGDRSGPDDRSAEPKVGVSHARDRWLDLTAITTKTTVATAATTATPRPTFAMVWACSPASA